ncbi:MAG: vWA domain-containing protein [Patescibacteria group bacterium]
MRVWALGRRIIYGSGFLVFSATIATSWYFLYLYEPANCFDNVQNGNESGIDCGGGCVRICAVDVAPPQVLWAKSFKITDSQYNAVAYVENRNQTAATPELNYTFILKNKDTVVAERSGTTVLPPNSVYPIFEGRILIGTDEAVTDTEIILEGADLWLPATVGRDQFRALGSNLVDADSHPRLNVEIENTELTRARDVEVVATIFSQDGLPVTASQTFIESIEPRTTSEIVFTWPESIAKTVRSCAVPTDVAMVIDLSGSMNNDAQNPPQPLTDALSAASEFVRNLKERDQVTLVTFASEAAVAAELSSTSLSVADIIKNLQIAPAEETGFTNTAAALIAAHVELNSEHHNSDARRVVVLLTDGLPTAPKNADALQPTIDAAETLTADNVEMYAIGLGAGADHTFIRTIAGDDTNAFFAPSRSDLSAIYEEITAALCESGPAKIEVIAKTKTNFAPLR